eukprot:359841-Chlamydomonas_euryale.AAC.2
MVFTPRRLSVFCSFLSSVDDVLCTAFFFLHAPGSHHSPHKKRASCCSRSRRPLCTRCAVAEGAAGAVIEIVEGGLRLPVTRAEPCSTRAPESPPKLLIESEKAPQQAPEPADDPELAPAHGALAASADLRTPKRGTTSDPKPEASRGRARCRAVCRGQHPSLPKWWDRHQQQASTTHRSRDLQKLFPVHGARYPYCPGQHARKRPRQGAAAHKKLRTLAA